MGEKDITEKILEDHNDVFADIINGLIFAGEQRILPESLENTAVHSQYKADDEKVHELERDVAKYWKDQDVQLAICGIENQSSVEKYMPFRIIGYDGTAYRSQLQDKRKEILLYSWFNSKKFYRNTGNRILEIERSIQIYRYHDLLFKIYENKVRYESFVCKENSSYAQFYR